MPQELSRTTTHIFVLAAIGASSGCYHAHITTYGARAHQAPWRETASSPVTVPVAVP